MTDNLRKLEILKQESPAQEHLVFEDETELTVHLVVKKHPFLLIIESKVDLSKYKLSGLLIYDYEDEAEERREVPSVRSAPLDFKGKFCEEIVSK
jgi:hypothetical protein